MGKINWKKIGEEFLNLIFPRFCYGCKKEGSYICDDCEVFLSENKPVCPMCGNPSFTGESCKSCIGRYGLDGMVAGWDYEGVVKMAILDIKAGYHDVALKMLESFFIMMITQEERFNDFISFLMEEDVKVTYVSESRNNNKRGLMTYRYGKKMGHSKALAKNLIKISGKDATPIDLLKKSKQTEKQAKLSKKERLENVKGAFEVKKDPPEKLVLVDDVFTTGATLRECCKELKKRGAKKVWGFVLARSS